MQSFFSSIVWGSRSLAPNCDPGSILMRRESGNGGGGRIFIILPSLYTAVTTCPHIFAGACKFMATPKVPTAVCDQKNDRCSLHNVTQLFRSRCDSAVNSFVYITCTGRFTIGVKLQGKVPSSMAPFDCVHTLACAYVCALHVHMSVHVL